MSPLFNASLKLKALKVLKIGIMPPNKMEEMHSFMENVSN